MDAHFAWRAERAGRYAAGIIESKSVSPFSRAKSTQAALSTATSAFSANVARSLGLQATFRP